MTLSEGEHVGVLKGGVDEMEKKVKGREETAGTKVIFI